VNVHIITLFPELFQSTFSKSIIKRAQDKKLLTLNLINLRQWGIGKHKQVDDKPYGGGSGMVMMMEPLTNALGTIKPKPHTILLSASGKKYNQKNAKSLAKKKNIAIICGHYEGIDARIEKYVDEIFSIGDFVVTGGEIPAMLIVDSLTRLLPGVIKAQSTKHESFEGEMLEHPQYTRPEVYKGLKVPQVLIEGNHKEIEKWRLDQSKKITKKNRPDLHS